jgi:nucleotide-binding universal stress UspA family protein
VSSVRRVIVGASGSPSSLQVLRYAQHLACDLGATLVPVLAWLPPDGDLADRRTPCEELRRLWAQDARERLQDALSLAWGELPADLPVRPVILRGRPGPVLVNAACRPGDPLLAGPATGSPGPDRGRPGEPLLPGLRPVPCPDRPAAPARPGNAPWSAGTGVLAPDAYR